MGHVRGRDERVTVDQNGDNMLHAADPVSNIGRVMMDKDTNISGRRTLLPSELKERHRYF